MSAFDILIPGVEYKMEPDIIHPVEQFLLTDEAGKVANGTVFKAQISGGDIRDDSGLTWIFGADDSPPTPAADRVLATLDALYEGGPYVGEGALAAQDPYSGALVGAKKSPLSWFKGAYARGIIAHVKASK